MLTRDELIQRRCVEGLIQVLEQIPARVAAREPIVMDDATMGLVALWTLLRWERTFLIRGLEEMGLDVWAVTCDVDATLAERRATAPDPTEADVSTRTPLVPPKQLDRLMRRLLDRAGREAELLGHPFLGTEHVLLAILKESSPELTDMTTRHGLTYPRVEDRIRQMLGDRAVMSPPRAPGPSKPHYASWDSEAVGVPRRFGMSVMFLMMTMYAVLFAVMQLLGTAPPVFAVVAILVTGVGFGQMILFGGRYPRAASIWVGAILFPIEILGVFVWYAGFPASPSDLGAGVVFGTVIGVVCVLPGALLGYLAGCVAAGAFMLIERYGTRSNTEPVPDAEIVASAEDTRTVPRTAPDRTPQ